MRRIAIALSLLALSAAAADAQTDTIGPKKGAWGGEGCLCPFATLLKFRDPTSAWLWRFQANYSQQRIETETPTGPQVDDSRNTANVSVGFGARFYRMTETRAHPYMSLMGNVGWIGGSGVRGYTYGASAEMGSAWFFTSNFSAGVSGSLDLTARSNSIESGGITTKYRDFQASFAGPRVTAAVYF